MVRSTGNLSSQGNMMRRQREGDGEGERGRDRGRVEGREMERAHVCVCMFVSRIILCVRLIFWASKYSCIVWTCIHFLMFCNRYDKSVLPSLINHF